MLLESLYKKYKGDEEKREYVKQSWNTFKQVGSHLNEIKRDRESIIFIEKVTKCLNVVLPFEKSFKDFGK